MRKVLQNLLWRKFPPEGNRGVGLVWRLVTNLPTLSLQHLPLGPGALMKLTRFARLFALPAALALTTLAAHADTFDWSLTGPSASLGGFPETGSGSLTATLVTGNEWEITSITGTLGGSTITGLTNYGGADNLLFPSSTLLDTSGLGVETANGTELDIFSFYAPGSTDITPGNNYGEIVSVGGFGVGTFSLTDTTSPVPEPSTLLMLGTGLLGAAGVARRKLFRA